MASSGPSVPVRTIDQFLDGTRARVDAAIESAGFVAGQRELLWRVVRDLRATQQQGALANPVVLFWLVARALSRPIDEVAVALGAVCEFYVLSLSLFDDIQDDDLSRTPLADAGPALAINSALLFYSLGLGELERAMEIEPEAPRRQAYLRVFNTCSRGAGNGQYLDLLGATIARTPAQVMAMERMKTSSPRLFCQLGALFGGAAEEIVVRYGRIGEAIGLVSQMVGDIADLFSPRTSRDLATGKCTYPIACFLEATGPDGNDELDALRKTLPECLPVLRRRLYDSGAIEEVAKTVEMVRGSLHAEVARLENPCAEHRTLLYGVDALCRKIYRPPFLACSEAIIRPVGGWHSRVRNAAHQFAERMTRFAGPVPPLVVPWHLPQWVYDPEARQVYYPDVEGLREETLPFQAALLGVEDLDQVRVIVDQQVPAVLAHEMFHYWRHVSGSLSQDTWFEERVANLLALAYCREHEPELFPRMLELASSVVSRREGEISAAGWNVLSALLGQDQHGGTIGYGVGLCEMAVIQLAMIVRLSNDLPSFEDLHARYLAH